MMLQYLVLHIPITTESCPNDGGSWENMQSAELHAGWYLWVWRDRLL